MLERGLVTAALMWGTHSAAATTTMGQAPVAPLARTAVVAPFNAYADVQSFMQVVYPDLAEDHRYTIWFETFRTPMESLISSRGMFVVFVAPRTVVPGTPDAPGVVPAVVLRAHVGMRDDGSLREFSASGSFVNWPQTEAVLSIFQQHRPTTDEQFRHILISTGARFLPGMDKELLAHVRPVIAEVERRFGKLTITDVSPPALNPGDLPTSTPSPDLAWSIHGDARRGDQISRVGLAFEPFGGRVLFLSISRE